jgi:hypothetical protein
MLCFFSSRRPVALVIGYPMSSCQKEGQHRILAPTFEDGESHGQSCGEDVGAKVFLGLEATHSRQLGYCDP